MNLFALLECDHIFSVALAAIDESIARPLCPICRSRRVVVSLHKPAGDLASGTLGKLGVRVDYLGNIWP